MPRHARLDVTASFHSVRETQKGSCVKHKRDNVSYLSKYRNTNARDTAEAAFKTATTKPVEIIPPPPSIPGAKEQVSLRIDRDVLAFFQGVGPVWQDRINETLRRAEGL